MRFCFQLHCMSVSVSKNVASVSIQVCEHVAPSCFACPALPLSWINITAGIAETGRWAKSKENKTEEVWHRSWLPWVRLWLMAFKHWTLGDCQFVYGSSTGIQNRFGPYKWQIQSLQGCRFWMHISFSLCECRRLPFRRTRRSPRQTSGSPLDCHCSL